MLLTNCPRSPCFSVFCLKLTLTSSGVAVSIRKSLSVYFRSTLANISSTAAFVPANAGLSGWIVAITVSTSFVSSACTLSWIAAKITALSAIGLLQAESASVRPRASAWRSVAGFIKRSGGCA